MSRRWAEECGRQRVGDMSRRLATHGRTWATINWLRANSTHVFTLIVFCLQGGGKLCRLQLLNLYVHFEMMSIDAYGRPPRRTVSVWPPAPACALWGVSLWPSRSPPRHRWRYHLCFGGHRFSAHRQSFEQILDCNDGRNPELYHF